MTQTRKMPGRSTTRYGHGPYFRRFATHFSLLLSLWLPRLAAEQPTFLRLTSARLFDTRSSIEDTPFLVCSDDTEANAVPGDSLLTSLSTEPKESAAATPDQTGDMEYNRDLPARTTSPVIPQKRQRNSDCPPDAAIAKFRKSCYQGISLSSFYMHDNTSTGLAITGVDLSTTLAVPLGSFDNLLLITPFFRPDFLDSAASLNLPSEVFETGVRGFWKRSINERLGTMVIVTPGMRTDFQNTDGAFRIFGLGLLTWQAVPETLSLSGGVVHTGREDFPLLPAFGLLWTPTPDWRFDIQFPSPRISHRIQKDGQNSETWAYLSGVFGGNSWAVERPDGARDEMTLRDYRLITGVEHVLAGNRSLFGEAGLVFGRSLEFTNSSETIDLDGTWMLRCGVTF